MFIFSVACDEAFPKGGNPPQTFRKPWNQSKVASSNNLSGYLEAG
jgi:hypothetical protein